MTERKRRWGICAGLLAAALLVSAPAAWAGRCGTGRHGAAAAPLPPRARVAALAAARTVAPVTTAGAHVHTTAHFRVLWGDDYPAGDPQWQDLDGDGVPLWVETLGAALEDALVTLDALGFPAPYGVDAYYLDAYVANTGVVVDGVSSTIGTGFFALTEIDTQYQVAFFTFAPDFSRYTGDELGVLRATAAHELFHAVQRALGYPWDDEVAISAARWDREGWWLEASATWLEAVAVPDVDDYVTYVNEFLSRPHSALSSQDGLREYGASIFAGYLWQRFGGAGVVREVYQNAYAVGLEQALREAVSTGGSLEDVVAAFWARAATPSADVWPDAEQFAPPPRVAMVDDLPAVGGPEVQEQPARFGANVVHLGSALLPTTASLAWSAPGVSWRLAVPDGSGTGAGVLTPVAGATFSLAGDGSGRATDMVVVNVSAADGTGDYTVRLGGGGAVTDPDNGWRSSAVPEEPTPAGSGGGGGGCFVSSLVP